MCLSCTVSLSASDIITHYNQENYLLAPPLILQWLKVVCMTTVHTRSLHHSWNKQQDKTHPVAWNQTINVFTLMQQTTRQTEKCLPLKMTLPLHVHFLKEQYHSVPRFSYRNVWSNKVKLLHVPVHVCVCFLLPGGDCKPEYTLTPETHVIVGGTECPLRVKTWF